MDNPLQWTMVWSLCPQMDPGFSVVFSRWTGFRWCWMMNFSFISPQTFVPPPSLCVLVNCSLASVFEVASCSESSEVLVNRETCLPTSWRVFLTCFSSWFLENRRLLISLWQIFAFLFLPRSPLHSLFWLLLSLNSNSEPNNTQPCFQLLLNP